MEQDDRALCGLELAECITEGQGNGWIDSLVRG
jgi:hypothetical protein